MPQFKDAVLSTSLIASLIALTIFLMPMIAHAENYKDTSYTYGELPVVTGGVDEDDRSHLEAMQHQYSLKLVMSGMKGNFLADADVRIEDNKGNLFVHETVDGPILLANLPTGKYTVTVTYEGEVRKQVVAVKLGKLKIIQVRFPIPEDYDDTNTR
ncbi:MAG: carboxypeptidase regulatory-like domain-containing protein [Alphaproteobacteria bacterium]|nr:carboxypeptidase regulatory-like domain-containing protein [Alphaproteobacteria bacterium]